MRFIHRNERADLANYTHEQNVICSAKLLAAIKLHHGETPVVEPEPVKAVSPRAVPIPAKRIRKEPVRPIALSQAFKQAWECLERPSPVAGKVELIQRAVLTFYPFTMNDLKSIRRTAPVVRARQIAMYLVKEMTGRSFPDIGRKFGGRDHTTALHAFRKIERMVATDAAFAAHISEIRNFIEGSQNEAEAHTPDRVGSEAVALASPDSAPASPAGA